MVNVRAAGRTKFNVAASSRTDHGTAIVPATLSAVAPAERSLLRTRGERDVRVNRSPRFVPVLAREEDSRTTRTIERRPIVKEPDGLPRNHRPAEQAVVGRSGVKLIGQEVEVLDRRPDVTPLLVLEMIESFDDEHVRPKADDIRVEQIPGRVEVAGTDVARPRLEPATQLFARTFPLLAHRRTSSRINRDLGGDYRWSYG